MKPLDSLFNTQKQKEKTTNNTYNNIIIMLPLCLLLLTSYFTKPVAAETVSSENYSVDIGNIDTNPQPSPRPQILGTHLTTINNETGYNYSITTSGDTFSFAISQNDIDYGILSSTNPIIRTSDIYLSGSLLGSQLLGYENHPLFSSTKDVIQNTSCDNGACSPQVGAIWDNTLTFGFGYRCDSSLQSACDPQFQTQEYYKTYPDQSRSQLPETIIMQNSGIKMSKTAITYKVNISGTQKTGGYYNSLTYLAVPGF
jgi:hypothetical protein